MATSFADKASFVISILTTVLAGQASFPSIQAARYTFTISIASTYIVSWKDRKRDAKFCNIPRPMSSVNIHHSNLGRNCPSMAM